MICNALYTAQVTLQKPHSFLRALICMTAAITSACGFRLTAIPT